ncbi:MAG TPA: choice-of-anchor D domain-containing protein, partial [Candidatus Binataceae bacterium]|nr:choice-of-anchor D domain-containing protein [Candidatus Binataceae bacterium]
NNTIFIGTHGKGVFKLALATSTPSATPTPSGTPTPTPTGTATPTSTPVPGTLTVSPASITFPTTAFGASGATSAQKTVTVTNPKKGKNPPSITVTNVVLAGDSNGTYTFVNNGCAGVTLAPGKKCPIILVFTPLAAGKSTGSVTVSNNSSTKPELPVKLAGTGAFGSLTASPKSLKFPATPVGTTSAAVSVSVLNKTTAPIGISGVKLSGKDPSDYSVAADTCSGQTVAASSSCSVSLTFTPTAKGSRPATLVVVGTTKSSLNINVSGSGK